MEKIHLKDDFIKLGQALKLAGLVDSGVEAKIVIQDGKVSVNGAAELQGKEALSGRCGILWRKGISDRKIRVRFHVH